MIAREEKEKKKTMQRDYQGNAVILECEGVSGKIHQHTNTTHLAWG